MTLNENIHPIIMINKLFTKYESNVIGVCGISLRLKDLQKFVPVNHCKDHNLYCSQSTDTCKVFFRCANVYELEGF